MRNRLAALAAACVLCMGLNACGNASQTYTEYVQAVMDCTYLGNDEAYRKMTRSSDTEVQQVRQDEIRYLSEQLCHQASADRSKLSAETVSGYDALAESLLAKVKYATSDAVHSGDTYQITITAEPIDLFVLSVPDMETAYRKDFAEKFYKAAEGTEQYDKLEADWGSKALEIYNNHAGTLGYQEPQSLTVPIRADADGHYTVSASDWQKIDSLLFGLRKPQ